MAKQSTAKQERKQDSEIDTRTVSTKQKSAAPNLDRLIHERLRLGIISALAANASLTFSELKNLMNTTDGNLSVHARKLEEAGYISCSKYFLKKSALNTLDRLSSIPRRWMRTQLYGNTFFPPERSTTP